MSDIVYVSPQAYLISADGWKSDFQRSGFIPILKADLAKLEHSLQKVVQKHGNLKNSRKQRTGTKQKQSEDSDPSNAELLTGNDIKATEGGTKYQSLKHFLPISSEQRLHTVAFQGLRSSLSNESIERIISKCIQLSAQTSHAQDDQTDLFECWTTLHFVGLEVQDVFVRFKQGNEKLYSHICQTLRSLFSNPIAGVEFHMDSQTSQFVKEEGAAVPETNAALVETLKTAIQNLEPSRGTATEDDFSSVNYQIDLSTLSDLPKDSLEQLCKDIVEFRTKVVSIEKEKREHQMYEESERRRQQMMKMFRQIRKSRNENIDSDDDADDNDEGTDAEGDEQRAGGEDEDDYAIETRRLEKEKEQSAREYEDMLNRLHSQIEPRIRSLQASIRGAENYEQKLEKRRPLFLKELLHQAHDQYYDHHRAFKAAEERKDAVDREQHGEQTISSISKVSQTADTNASDEKPGDESGLAAASAPAQDNISEPPESSAELKQFKIKFAFKKAIDKSLDGAADLSAAPSVAMPLNTPATKVDRERPSAGPLADDLPFTQAQLDQRLHALRHSKVVDELIKEYLGVYEDELVDYILDNIREHKNKQILLDELKETFDDDAETIVAAIWSSSALLNTN
ncbi:hypothetical protein HG535_0E03540 [Zygotorulaspora mrakii]|uniref:U1 small nuclear ribonucleoprotein component SNU71 n=1 Tax=Zygotorulaspora mrakii TaxID=42260 RepID=A0A7H9B3S5_ZYGMR|nr:uncharacterized protein HG535_0E03540 [Zygotorulaspora mrakii]QLG73270.1 hypothetical protein HG535_0E03540 [Zygotorulaspora mrakii]